MNRIKVLTRHGAKGTVEYFDDRLNFPFVVKFSEETQVLFPVPDMFNFDWTGSYLPSHGENELDITHYFEGRVKVAWPKKDEEKDRLFSAMGVRLICST